MTEKKSGYKNPPAEHQFKKGQSGNPKGRPKGRKNLKSIFEKTAQKKITLSANGKEVKVTLLEATITRLFEKAMKGDARSIDTVMKHAQSLHLYEDHGEQNETFSSDDAAILATYENRLKNKLNKGGDNE